MTCFSIRLFLLELKLGIDKQNRYQSH